MRNSSCRGRCIGRGFPPIEWAQAVEVLEARRLLSVADAGLDETDAAMVVAASQATSVADDRTVSPIEWGGQSTVARRGQWVARFDGVAGTPAEQVQAVGALLADGLHVAGHLGADGLVLVEVPADLAPVVAYESLSHVPGLRFVEPNFVDGNGNAVPNDPHFGRLWNLDNTGQFDADTAFPSFPFLMRPQAGVADADIDAAEAWDLTTGGHGLGHGRNQVVVAEVDTGVDYTHPDLAPNVWQNRREAGGAAGVDDDGNGFVDDVHGWDFRNDDSDPMDDRGHGTHVAGTIGGVGNNGVGVAGINWGVRIMPLKFLDANAVGTVADAVEAINYATMMRRRGVNLRVINASWGFNAFSSALREAVAAAGEAGILVVAAAGNDRRDLDLVPQYPAALDLGNVIAVAATDNRDNRAGFSSFGARSVDLGAPGRNVFSTDLSGGYSYRTGTSMSVPHVVGVAALGWRVRPNASYQRVRDAIFAGVDRLPSLQGITVTGGRLNAFNTLRLLEPEIESGELAAAQPEDSSTVATSGEATSDLLHGAEEPLL